MKLGWEGLNEYAASRGLTRKKLLSIIRSVKGRTKLIAQEGKGKKIWVNAAALDRMRQFRDTDYEARLDAVEAFVAKVKRRLPELDDDDDDPESMAARVEILEQQVETFIKLFSKLDARERSRR